MGDRISKLFLSLVLLLNSCGKKDQVDSKESDIYSQFEKKLAFYEAQLKERLLDEYGFIRPISCDSLLFSGLIAGPESNIEIAEDQQIPGKFYRTPDHACYTGLPGSEISRDMLLGLAWGAKNTGHYAIGRRVLDYGQAHGWIMGQGAIEATLLTWPLRKTFAQIAALGGDDTYKDFLGYPDLWVGGLLGFMAHLEVTHILLRGDLDGGLGVSARAVLWGYADREPRNAYFQYAHHSYSDGDMSKALETLMDESLFPSDHLPVRCQEWLWQRQPEYWDEACAEPFESAADFVFVGRLIKEFMNHE